MTDYRPIVARSPTTKAVSFVTSAGSMTWKSAVRWNILETAAL